MSDCTATEIYCCNSILCCIACSL